MLEKQKPIDTEEAMESRFAGKVMLITGGNSGIGLATAKRLATEGAEVVITGRDTAKLEAAVKEIGPSCFGIGADVSYLKEVDLMYQQIKEKYRRVDGVFANAGIAIMEPIEQVTEASFATLIDTNLKGVFFTLQRAIPLLGPGSAMVVNASVSGVTGSSNSAVYGATKAAVRALARSFSAALIERGIRVNAVSPGPIDTPIWEGVDADRVRLVTQATPAKRFGTAGEVAAAVAFLLSSESSYIVGSELFVDGGMTQL
jgi:NAD(P)-dependent dehydrogenase (short-subunit alcohol dehydrogenase family)